MLNTSWVRLNGPALKLVLLWNGTLTRSAMGLLMPHLMTRRYEPHSVLEADAARHGADPVLVYKAQRRSRKDRMTKAGPIELTFDTEQKMTGLEIIGRHVRRQ